MGVLADSSSLAAWAIWAGIRGRGLHRMHGQGLQRRFDRQRFHVLGDGQIDRAGPLRLGEVEGVADHLGGRAGVRRVSAHLVTGLNMATRSTT